MNQLSDAARVIYINRVEGMEEDSEGLNKTSFLTRLIYSLSWFTKRIIHPDTLQFSPSSENVECIS